MTFTDYRSLPYVYPERPTSTAGGRVLERQRLFDILRRANSRAADCTCVHSRRVGTERSTMGEAAGSVFLQVLNTHAASRLGGVTQTPWQIGLTNNNGVFSINYYTIANSPSLQYPATDYPPSWLPGCALILPTGTANQVFALMPGGDSHDQIASGRSGLLFPSDYQSVGVYADCMFIKHSTAEDLINWSWLRDDKIAIQTGASQSGTFDGTLLQGSSPAHATAVVFTTPALTFGANIRGSLSICGNTGVLDVTGLSGTTLASVRFRSAQSSQYGLVTENWGYAPVADTTGHATYADLSSVSEAMGTCDFWQVELDIWNINGGGTASDFYDRMISLVAYLRTIADVPIVYDYQANIERFAGGASDDTEFDQVFGAVCQLVDNGYITLAVNSRLAAEQQLGYTRALQTLAKYTIKTYNVLNAYSVDDVYVFTDNAIYACITAASAGQNPTTHAAKWRDMRWASGYGYVAGDVVIQYTGRVTATGPVISAQWVCVEAHTASTSNAPGNAHYWRLVDLWGLMEGVDTITAATRGRVQPTNQAQEKLARTFMDLLLGAALGGAGTNIATPRWVQY